MWPFRKSKFNKDYIDKRILAAELSENMKKFLDDNVAKKIYSNGIKFSIDKEKLDKSFFNDQNFREKLTNIIIEKFKEYFSNIIINYCNSNIQDQISFLINHSIKFMGLEGPISRYMKNFDESITEIIFKPICIITIDPEITKNNPVFYKIFILFDFEYDSCTIMPKLNEIFKLEML